MLADLILVCIVLVLVTAAVPRVWRRIPEPLREDLVRVVREVRRRVGPPSLRLLMLQMFDDMRGSVLPGVTRTYVPNEMRFGLHPDDVARWGRYFHHMSAELKALMLREIAHRRDLHLVGELRVGVEQDADAEPGRPTFTAGMDVARSVRDEATVRMPEDAVDEALTRPDEPDGWVLAPPDGPPVLVVKEITIGRGREADLRIESEPLSRLHARVAVRQGRPRIVDLDSTNGTFVNDQRVGAAMLAAGDVIRLGSGVELTIDRQASR